MKFRAMAALALAAGAMAGCSSGSETAATAKAGASATPAAGATGYWTDQRLRSAAEFHPQDWATPSGSAGAGASASATPSARQNAKTLRVGAIFSGGSGGDHFCTASVVDSPGRDVIVTAAHCVNDGHGGGNKPDIVFIPAYSGGDVPYGEWQPARYVMDPRWTRDHDPDLDIAFIVLKSYQGKNIQEVLGANKIAFGSGYRHYVRVIGYPSSADAPIDCQNWTSEQSPTQLTFACQDFTGGTSGSPWLTDYDAQARTGTIVGVLGGYQEGGDTPDVSYSAYLNDDIKKLYDQAISG